MTLFGWGNPRYFPRLPAPTIRYFDVDTHARVLAHCHWQPRPWERVTVVLLHGLNGSSDAHYMRGVAAKGFARGMNVVRLNQRNCGETEHLSAGLFHSGLTSDVRRVVDELIAVDDLSSLGVAGYSLGGNLALKLAGEYGNSPPSPVKAVCAVSPIIEISPCVRALERPANFLYQWNFVRGFEAPHATKGSLLARPVRPHEAHSDTHGAGIRRGFHRAAFRVQERRRLLSSGQRNASCRSHLPSRARHDRRGRPIRPVGAVSGSQGRRQPTHRRSYL